MPELSLRLAVLCREMESGDLQAVAAEMGAEPLLDRIIAALAGGAGPATLGPALDELDAALIAYGVPGGLVPPTWRNYMPSPAAAGAPYPAIEVWACPAARCERWQHVDPAAAETPACAVDGTPLAKRQLSG
jgi:hypothetical protein